VKNRHDKPVRAYIRTLKQSGWELRNKPKGTVETPEAFVVPLDVASKGSAKIDVELAQRAERTVGVDSNSTTELFRMYLAGGKAPPNVAKVLKEVLELKGQVNDKQKERNRLQAQHAELSRDQDRVRANINVLRKTPGNAQLQADLARKLAKLEEDLGKLSGRLVQLSEEIAEIEARMKVLIQGISLDAK
jgi:hypothetical protein